MRTIHDLNSNTTFVKVKSQKKRCSVYISLNSNTTFVKVKLVSPSDEEKTYEFKYNIC